MSDSPDNVVPLQQPQWLNDSFVNFLAGLGVPGRDKFASQQYVFQPMTLVELENAYRGDWIARKAVAIPAWDMTREWRKWQADPDQITLLEETEKKLFIQQKVQQALIKARLYGGAAIIIGVDAGAPEEELNLDLVLQDSLKFIHVVSKNQLTAGPIVYDISSKYFGQPEYYEARNTPASKSFEQNQTPVDPNFSTKQQVRLHPSRVVKLIGVDTADQMLNDIWGDSVLQAVNDAVKMCGLVTGSLATLVAEMKVDVIKIPELKSILSTKEGERKMMARFQAANVAKSVVNTIMIDGNEEWQRITASLNGFENIVVMYMQVASGAVDIPAGRFLGLPHRGLNVTGEADFRNYYDRLASEQKITLEPAMTQLDEVLIRSALGERPPEVWYEWNSLWQMDAAEKADIALKKAQVYQIDVASAQLPPVALANARANQLIEDGVYPGLEQALEDAALEGDTIESENEAAPLHPAMAAMASAAENGEIAPPIPPGQPGGPPMPAPGGTVIPFPMKTDASALEDFNQCHNQSGEEGGEFCGEGGEGSSGAGEVGKKGGGGSGEGKRSGTAHPEARKQMERGPKGSSKGVNSAAKQAAPKGTAKAEKKPEAKAVKAAKPKSEKGKSEKGKERAAKAKAREAKKGERAEKKKATAAKRAEKKKATAAKKGARATKRAELAKTRGEKKTAREAKKAERATTRGEKKTAREAKKAEREKTRGEKKTAAEAKRAEKKTAAASKKAAAAKTRGEKKQAAAEKRAGKAAAAKAKKEGKGEAGGKGKGAGKGGGKGKGEQGGKGKAAPKPKQPKGGGEGGGGKGGGGKGGGSKQSSKGGKGGGGGEGKAPKAPKQAKEAKEAQAPKAPKPAKEASNKAAEKQQKQEQREAAQAKKEQESQKGHQQLEAAKELSRLEALGKPEGWTQEQYEAEKDRLRRLLGDSLVVRHGDAAYPQFCDECGGYHLCSSCGGALFDHNMCHGPDGKFCSDPSGGPTRAEQRESKAYERAAKSSMGGGGGKKWDFPHEEKPKGKYESPSQAAERGKRNREREREAGSRELERRIGEALRRGEKKGTAEQAAVEVAVGIGKAAKWAYGKLRKGTATAPKPKAAASVKRGRGRPRTRPIGPKRPRGRPRKR